ncbi:MAG: carbohydrate ABC transporter permease, partial [Halanaerobiales bacterium]
TMIVNVPFIIGFSFFAALILNQKFKGRLMARTVFFLPVIYSAGIILRMENTDYLSQLMMGAEEAGNTLAFSGASLRNLLNQLNIPPTIINYILLAVDRIPVIIRSSGIQILIFLAGLQAIPSSIYESAKVEGSSAWESFWLITLPMLSPVILVNMVYSIVDFFTSPENELIDLIRDTAFRGAGYGASMAMALSYFLILILCLGIIFKIISRYVFYHE